MTYPPIFDKHFKSKLHEKLEFNMHTSAPSNHNVPKDVHILSKAQCIVRNFMSPLTPYNGILIAHGTGTGKTCSAIAVCEQYLKYSIHSKPLVYYVTKLTLIDQIKSSIKSVCSSGRYSISYRYIQSEDENERTELINTQFDNEYNIISHQTFSNLCSIKHDFSNCILIFDEAHNLRNGGEVQLYDTIINMIERNRGLKIMLLTATPIYDSHLDIISLLNILLKNDGLPSLNSDDQFDTHYFKSIISGYVSYYYNTSSYPDTFKVIKSHVMTPIQQDEYNKGDNDIIRQQISNVFKHNETYHSSKMSYILKSILNPSHKGPIVIYSRFIDNGIRPMCSMLESHGYNRYMDSPLNSQNKYIVITGNPKYVQTNITKSINTFNDMKNCHGDIIKVLLISDAAMEGFDLKNVRQLHILEPWYNLSKLKQIEGRVARYRSHYDLPIHLRNVVIFHHIGSDIDESMQKLSNRKQHEMNSMIENLKLNAFDSGFYYVKSDKSIINTLFDGTKKSTSTSKEVSIKIKQPSKIDSSTFYHLVHATDVYEYIMFIISYFKKHVSGTPDDIIFQFKFIEYRLDKSELITVLDELVLQCFLIIHQNVKGSLILFDTSVYKFQPDWSNLQIMNDIERSKNKNDVNYIGLSS